MSAVTATNVLRPGANGFRRWLTERAMAAIPLGFRILRTVRPIPKFGSTFLVTLHDDVREVFGTDASFRVPYEANLRIITGGEPFILGMDDGPAYRSALRAMHDVTPASDLPVLGDRAEDLAGKIVGASGGRVEVVDLIRRVSFALHAGYFGVPEPEPGQGSLDVWGTRLFEFQFMGRPADTDLRGQVDAIAPAFRAHIDREIARRKNGGAAPSDDVLARCLRRQEEGVPGYSDAEIRTALLCMVVGGPPQPPMVVPQALEQLLRRPAALKAARNAAAAGSDELLWRIVREAMRFDPLAPGLPRVATRDHVVAQGTRRARSVPKGATVIVCFASAMMDDRRVPEPERFDPDRRPHEYVHFGYGLHRCFALAINEWTLHRMLKPLLVHERLRRAPGPEGHLAKNGPFADKLVVRFD
jgi:cytochrome P450